MHGSGPDPPFRPERPAAAGLELELHLANPHLPGPSMANAAVFSHRRVTFLPVHLVAATDPHHQDTQHIVLNIANHAAIPYPIPP